MIEVRTPPETTPAPPARDPVTPWLGIVSLLLLVDALVPWERYCRDAFDDFPARCFSARLWNGSASLFGLAALLLLVGFVIATARMGIRSPIGIGRLTVFAAILAMIVAKTVMVAVNDTITSEHQSQGGPAWLGVWIGGLLGAVGLSLFLASTWRATPRLRSIVTVGVVALAVTALAIPYARSGLAWWGGPIAEPAFLGGGNGLGLRLAPGESGMLSGLLYFRNPGAVAATFDSLELVEGSRGIDVLGTYAVTQGPCEPGSEELGARLLSGGCAYPLAGFRFSPGARNHIVQLVMVVEVQRPGVYRSGWIRVRYHAGMLPFEVFRTDMLTICAPEPGRKRCPGY